MEEKNVVEEVVETKEEIVEDEFLDLGVEMPDDEETVEEDGGEKNGTN